MEIRGHAMGRLAGSAEASKARLLTCGGHVERQQFRVLIGRGSWTNLSKFITPHSGRGGFHLCRIGKLLHAPGDAL